MYKQLSASVMSHSFIIHIYGEHDDLVMIMVVYCGRKGIGHANEYPKCIISQFPHTQSMMAYKILNEYIWKSQWKIALWECC